MRYKLARTLRLNNTEGVRDISYVTANVLINIEEQLTVVLLRLVVFFRKKRKYTIR